MFLRYLTSTKYIVLFFSEIISISQYLVFQFISKILYPRFFKCSASLSPYFSRRALKNESQASRNFFQSLFSSHCSICPAVFQSCCSWSICLVGSSKFSYAPFAISSTFEMIAIFLSLFSLWFFFSPEKKSRFF